MSDPNEGFAPDEDFIEAEATDPDEDEVPYDGKDFDSDYEDETEQAEIARREKERLKKMAEDRQQQINKFQQQGGGGNNHKNRMNFLMKQAEIFQHFMPSGLAKEGKKGKKGRHNTKSEEAEDAELLRDEEDEAGLVTHRLQVQPSIITNVTMRDYQLQGLNWLIHLYDNGINGILADEMGLGKTLQTISLLAYLREFRGISGPHLVIVPKSTLHNWSNEFRRFCPSVRVIKFHGGKDDRAVLRDKQVQPGKFDVCVTSYEMVIKEKGHFRKFNWRYLIIDEAHRIKNVNSRLSQVVRIFKTSFRLLITGTPLQNNLRELWALLNFLLPELFHSAESFEEWFNLGGDDGNEGEVVQQLHKLLRPFLLRRLKSDVEKGLPPKKEILLKIGMSELQKQYYKAIIQKDLDALDRGADRSRLLNIVMQLRKCCNHPYLFQGAEPGPPFITGEHLVENSGKMVLLDKLLPKLQVRGSRVLIFSQMTRLLDILEDYCLFRGYQYCRIDGNTGGDERESAIDDYNREGSSKFVFLLSTRAGGLGINLVTADTVVLYDSDWNPQMDLQAMDRAHRIGQKREVSVFRFCTANSIEEKVIEKAYRKLKLDALVIQQGRLTENTKAMNKEELQSMIRFGAEYVFTATGDEHELKDADIDALIAKGEQATKELNDKMSVFTENALKFSLGGDPAAMYDFKAGADEGAVDLKTLKSLAAAEWVNEGPRARKKADGDAARAAAAAAAAGPKQPKPIIKRQNLYDFCFYNRTRINELYDKEEAFAVFERAVKDKEESLRKQGASDEAIVAELESLSTDPSAPQPLSDEERAEREQLLQDGYSNWSKKDFGTFVKACEKHGRSDLVAVAREIEGKTEDEVRAYAAVFWERVSELDDCDKVLKQVERGEQRIQRQHDIMNAVARKIEKYKDPYNELRLMYGTSKGKAYSEEEDRFLICKVHELGYGQWDELKAEVRKSWRFKFDWFFKSRSPLELQRRADALIRLIEKEFEEMDGRSGAIGGGGRGFGGPGAGKRKATGIPGEGGGRGGFKKLR